MRFLSRKIILMALCICTFAMLAVFIWKSKQTETSRLPASEARFSRLTDFFQNEVDKGRLPGAVIMVQQHGRTLYLKSFGLSNTVTKRPMSPDTIFALHSMTKPVTSVAAMMLVDEGKISLKDPVSRYIPEFSTVQVGVEKTVPGAKPTLELVPPRRPITVEDLLRQTSGITYEYIGGELIKKAYTDAHLLEGYYNNEIFAKRIAALPLARQPGSMWRYGHSTDVLGRIIEIASGQSLYEFEKQRIFDPLQMPSTQYSLKTEEDRSRLAEPFPADEVLNLSEKVRRDHPEWESGGGGLVSTIIDYGHFAQMILDGGQWNGQRLLRPETFKAMTTNHIGADSGVQRDYYYFPGDGFGFGYGFAVRVEPGNAVPAPSGSMGELKWDSGSGTYFGVDPKLDMFYILLEQTQTEKSRITPLFRDMVYEGFRAGGSE